MRDDEAGTALIMGFLAALAHHPNRVITTGPPARVLHGIAHGGCKPAGGTLGFSTRGRCCEQG
jgi:hypothetical protein